MKESQEGFGQDGGGNDSAHDYPKPRRMTQSGQNDSPSCSNLYHMHNYSFVRARVAGPCNAYLLTPLLAKAYSS